MTLHMTRRAFIFDLDGTLVDSRRDLATAVNLLRAHYGLPPLDVNTITGFVGNGPNKLAERSLKGIDYNILEALDMLGKFYSEHLLDHTQLYPGIENCLDTLSSQGFVIAVATNKLQRFCGDILRHLGIMNYFDMVVGAGDIPLKPAPDMLSHILEKTSSDPASSWIVGDNYTDLESGRRAGMQRCFAKYGFGNPGTEPFDLEAVSPEHLAMLLTKSVSHNKHKTHKEYLI